MTTLAGGFLRHLHTPAVGWCGPATDAALLTAVVEAGDADALAALVARHAAMVWGVCRRHLAHHDAEDAFQATFLVLVHKAGTVVPRELLANWLFGVARQTAVRARAASLRRNAREKQVIELPEPAARVCDPPDDLRPVLDEELARLPDKFRTPIVLCDLEGKTRQEAARELGWPEGSVAGRLARGRTLLADRLSRRGVVGAAGLAAVANRAPAAVVEATIRAAGRLAAGGPAGVSAAVAELTSGVLRVMMVTKLNVAVVLISAWLVATAGAIFPGPAPADPRPAAKPSVPRLVVQAAPAIGWKERTVFTGHTDAVLSVSFGDGLLATAGRDGKVKLWNPATGKDEAEFSPLPEEFDIGGATLTVGLGWAKFGPGGKWLAVGGREGGGWAIRDFSEKRTGGKISGGTLFEVGIPRAITPDGTVWAFADGKAVHLIPFDPAGRQTLRGDDDPPVLKGHTDEVNAAAFSPDGKRVVTGSQDMTVRIWEIETGKEIAVGRGHTDGVASVAVSPDGKRVASGGKDATVRLWDAATGKALVVIESDDVPWALAFSPDGKWLAVGQNDHTIAVWDLAAGRRVATLKGHTGPVRAVEFGPDGVLASAGDDKTTRLWAMTK